MAAKKSITGNKVIDGILGSYDVEQKKASSKSMELIVRADKNKRAAARTDIEKKLKTAKIKFIALIKGAGSIGGTQILLPNFNINILYKPAVGSGGMNETTLNSTITELAPAIAFMSGYKFGNGTKGISTVEKLMEVVEANASAPVYIGNDLQQGLNFIKIMKSSSKYNEKMLAALGVLKYLTDEDKKDKIVKVYWGYRNKPAGVPKNHKGDLFLSYASGGLIGVSIKAGTEKSAEPQLNIYVRKLFRDFGRMKELDKLEDKVYKSIHSTLGLPVDWESSRKKRDSLTTILNYSKKYPADYEKLYDKMLEMIRQEVVNCFNTNLKDSKNFINTHVLDKGSNIPLVVIKGYDKIYKFITDEDALDATLPKVKSIVASSSSTSKQNWTIDLKHGRNEKLTMNMSIRSNKSIPENKVAQGVDLAIKFNGLKK